MITAATADHLDALALAIFNPHLDPGVDPIASAATGLAAQDDATDVKLASLIADVMLTIDGRALATGFKYTLNVTNALQLRPKHWYLGGVTEYNTANPGVSGKWPAYCGLDYVPPIAAGIGGGVNSYGFTIGLATCACICHAWAEIIRMWLAGNYPLAIAQPTS